MAPFPCRLLPFAVADGPGNMALDEALLQTAAESGRASLRFYAWEPATLSLGYFQSVGAVESDPLLASLPLVRRPSGGATLVHHLEVTYALVLPTGPPFRGDEPWPRRMHRAIVAALADLGVAADLASDETPTDSPLCFLHVTPADVVIAGHKIVGSAQRKHRGGVLQHGAILLERSPSTPALPGILELTGRRPSALDVADAVADRLAVSGCRLEPDDWSAEERRTAAEVVARRYTSSAWNYKR